MVAFLLDTNIVSELRKSSPDPNVAAWRSRHRRAEVYLSVVVVGELRLGIERLRARDRARAAQLESWLRGLVGTYGSRILPVTVDIAQEWGRMSVPPHPPAVDALIAATAAVHRLTLATRNVADFARAGVAVVNPFDGAA